MATKSLRLRVATGGSTLPAAVVIAILSWLVPAPTGSARWIGLAVTGVAAYVMVECNNRNALLRVRSRMTTASFLALTAACPFLHDWTAAMGAVPALLLAVTLIFATYQQPRAEGITFYAFLCLSLGSFGFPALLVLVPFLWLSMLVHLRSLTGRSFLASLLGLALPYWGYAGWAAWSNRLDTAFSWFAPWFRIVPPDYAAIPPLRLAALGLLLLLVVPAMVHFWHTAYNDKIRTRMLYHTLVLIELALWALLALRPDWHDALLRLLLASSAPFIGHHFALARGRFMDVWFIVCLALLALLAAADYLLPWMLSTTCS